eukprot:5915454-Pleurochrysis_carterae.AAC.1
MRSAHKAKSPAWGEVSTSRASRSALAAASAADRAAAAERAAADAPAKCGASAVARMAPKEKAAALCAGKSGMFGTGRTRASAARTARAKEGCATVPLRAVSVHQRKDAPAARARRREAGVRTTTSWSTTKGTGATARRGPPAYSPTRK